MIPYGKMTQKHVQLYADAIVRHHTPASIENFKHDMRNHIFNRKLEEIHDLVISFTDDIDLSVKEKIANNAMQKLMKEYKNIDQVEDHNTLKASLHN